MARVGPDADAPQVEPVGVPAGLDGHVGFYQAIGVVGAGVDQGVQIILGEGQQIVVQAPD